MSKKCKSKVNVRHYSPPSIPHRLNRDRTSQRRNHYLRDSLIFVWGITPVPAFELMLRGNLFDLSASSQVSWQPSRFFVSMHWDKSLPMETDATIVPSRWSKEWSTLEICSEPQPPSPLIPKKTRRITLSCRLYWTKEQSFPNGQK